MLILRGQDLLVRQVPDEYEKIFQIVKGGRDAALDFVRSSMESRESYPWI